MGRQGSRSWQAMKGMDESAMDLRQFRYYIEGTEQMSFTRGARRASAVSLAENQLHAHSAHDFGRNGNGHNAALEQFRALVRETLSLPLAMFSDMVCR